MLLQPMALCHVKMARMQAKAGILLKISWVNFFPDTRYIPFWVTYKMLHFTSKIIYYEILNYVSRKTIEK